MDELYENAWGEPSRTHADASTSAETWTSSKLPPTTHEEVELHTPSWVAGAEVPWNEHSGSPGFSWSTAEPDLAWGAGTYLDSDIQHDGGYGTTETTETAAAIEPQTQMEDEVKTDTLSPVSADTPPGSRPPSPPLDQQDTTVDHPLTSETRSSSPEGDAFGTFANAFDSNSKPFASDITPELDAGAWGSPWSAGAEQEDASEAASVDEWEVARKQKEKLDKRIPPEVLADILAQCTEYCREAWPDAKENSSNKQEEDWMSTWRNGMDSIEGLENLVQSIIPDLTLEPPVQFTKTSIAKSAATAIRLTKNLPSSKTSPMSHYLAARGSTAWENSIKERKVVEEDVIPVGWRLLEKQPASSVTETAKSTKTGGIFSFWSRRQSRISSTQGSSDSPREQSPSSPTGDASGGSRSARASQDSARSRIVKDEKVASPLTEAPSSTTAVPADIGLLVQSEPHALYSEAPDPHADGSTTPPPPQAPSAVSRFLNRFSRRKSSISVSSSHNSFALSGDDLEFLSDIVPSAADGDHDEDADFKALTNVLKPEPLPPAIPPPPSAPSIRPSSTISAKLVPPSSTSLLPASNPPPSKLQSQARDLDGLDFFGAFETSSVSGRSRPPVSTAFEPTPMRMPPADALANGDLSKIRRSELAASAKASRSVTTRPASPPSLFGSLMPTEKSASQAFYLPPPPPPSSRPHTPALLAPMPSSAASSPTSPASESGSSQRARSPALRPKVPLSFTIPPPSAAALVPSAPPSASSVMTTQSEIPLGELYPGTVMQGQPSHSSTTSFPAFTLPPPPSSRPFTPSAVPAPSATTPSLLSPPPSSSKPLIPAQQPSKAGDLFDDDDDFADFQSPVTSLTDHTPSAAPHTQTKPTVQVPFTLPPPPSRSTPLSTVSSLPPPRRSSALLGSTPSSPKTQSSDPFSEDFDTFLSSSSTGLQASGTKSSGLGFSFNSDKSLLTPQKGRRGGFEDGGPSPSALGTPSPPRPLSKSPRHTHQSVSIGRPGEKKVKPSQHLHTLSLMERAAATPGQWPAPPSPLPLPLSYPVPGRVTKDSEDLMTDDSFGAFESDTLAPSSSSPILLNPPARSTTLIGPQSSQSYPSLSQSSGSGSGYSALRPSSTSSSNNVKAGGGLSAQDLSFFEGL